MASLPRTPKSTPPQLKARAQREAGSGRLRQAIELLEELLRQTPDDWTSVQRLADLRVRSGDRRGAVELYRRLAHHYDQDDHVSRAIAAWRLVLRLDPAFLGTHLKLGELYARQGFRVESRIHYQTAIAGFERAGQADQAADARRALEAVEGRTAAAPTATSPPEDGSEPPSLDDAEFVAERLVEAKMFRRYQLLAQARDALEAILQRAPDHVEAREELVGVLREQGETERAAEEQRRLRQEGTPLTPAPSEPPQELEPTGGPLEAAPAAEVDIEDLDFEFIEEEPPSAGEITPPADPLDVSRVFDDVLAAAGQPREPSPDSEAVPTEAPGAAPAFDVSAVLREHVNAQISQEDYGARYDLGIAYREMGLVDEAIAEFQLAARDPDRLVDCASLMAGCFVEKGLPGLAVKWLERGLAAPGISEEEGQALRYELGDALERDGETTRALAVFTELYGESAGHRDVAERVRRLLAVQPEGKGT